MISGLRRRQLLSQSQHSRDLRSARIGGETLNSVSADTKINPLRDQMIVEPLDVVYSTRLIVKRDTKPLRGIVKAIGPGHYPSFYLDKDRDRLPDHRRGDRNYRAHGEHFIPTEVKVGDVVELGGQERDGYAFESFMWGDVLHIHCREADVCGVRDDLTEAEARAELRRVAA